jgi:hypothetical protein
MRLEVIVRNARGTVTDMVRALAPITVAVALADVEAGSEIEALVRDDEGKHLGTFVAPHAFQTRVVTAMQFESGAVAVTDDASNTYTREWGCSI